MSKTFSTIASITQQVPDIDCYLLYWSTKIGGVGRFRSLDDMLKIDTGSTGGTDPTCIFDYLSETQVIGNTTYRPQELNGVFIITDGYFGKDYLKYAEKYTGKTVWMITGDDTEVERFWNMNRFIDSKTNIEHSFGKITELSIA